MHAPRPRLLLIATLAVALVACGRKTDPKPPELVAPRAVSELALTTRADGVMIRWLRPTQYVDGSSMEDLAGFVLERSRNNEPFSEHVRVPVTDRGMFQKVKRFEYVDTAVSSGTTYHYRVVAFTTDGYYSADSGAATIEWFPPAQNPSPSASSRAGEQHEP